MNTKRVSARFLFILALALSLLAVFVYASAPSITITSPTTSQNYTVNTAVEISANVTDDVAVDTVLANITSPNGIVTQLTLSLQSAPKYNASFTTSVVPGTYQLLVWANDSSNNVNTANLNFTVDFVDPTNLDGLRFWLDASDNSTLYTDEACSSQVTSNGDTVRCWQDKSSYGHNATNVSGKGTPIFSTNVFNGMSVVNFSKSESDTLRHELASAYTSDFTIFTVIQSKDSSPDTYESFFSNGNPANASHFQIDYTSGGNSFRYGASTKFNFENFSNDLKLYSVTNNGSFVQLYNEGEQVNNGSVNEGRYFRHYRVNQNRNGDRHHDSYIGEIILYDRVLSACEQENLNVHLGNKYGRDFFGISDNYDFGSPHNNEINGIGEFDGSCTTTVEFTLAQSDIATISNPSALDLNDVLTFANDNGGFSLNTQSTTNYSQRVNQSWRVDVDNTPGTVTVSFDISSVDIVPAASNFALLIDSNTNFTDATEYTTGLTINGNTVSFTGVNFTNGEYFTLAISENPPTIEFIDPTLSNLANYSQDNFIVNISSNAYGSDHYTFVDFDNSLLLWMRMDDLNASSDPTDISQYSNNGSIVSSPVFNSTGRFGDAVHLDGIDDYIEIPDDPDLKIGTSDFTYSVWFNTKNIGAVNQQILCKRVGGGADYELQIQPTAKVRTYVGDTGLSSIDTSSSINTNQWYHVVVSRGNGTLYLYLNGVLENQTASSQNVSSTSVLRIGQDTAGQNENFNGSIDEVLLFNRSFSASEVASLYNATASAYENSFTNLTEGNHTFIGYTMAANGLKNQTQLRTVTLDFVPPSVTNIQPDSLIYNISTTIEIQANVTDVVSSVDTVLANITLPNGSTSQITLLATSGSLYNASYAIPPVAGNYSIRIIANDTAGNINDTQTTLFLADLGNPLDVRSVLAWYDGADNTTLYTDASCSTQVTGDLDQVLCWQNKANGTNATVASGKNPARFRSISSERIHTQTTLRFDKSNETGYQTGVDIRANTSEDITLFAVYRPRTSNLSDQGQAVWGNDNGAWDRFYYSLFNGLGADGVDDGLVSLGGASQGLLVDGAGVVDSILLLTTVYNGNMSSGSNSGPTNGSQIYFDGELQTVFTDQSHATAAQNQLFLGLDGDNGHYDGDLAEIIVYDEVLNLCQIELINNYLGQKYGKDFNNISNGYGFSAPHNNNINGVTETLGNCGVSTETTSATSSIATISSPSSLDLNDSLTFAHDNAGTQLLFEAPNEYSHRITQEWRVDVDNEPGTVSVAFDLSLTSITITNITKFALLIDTDGDFSNANIHTTGAALNGNTISFTNVNFTYGDYFSLAVNDTVPTIQSVILNSSLTTNLTSENLTAHIINLTDIDLDDVKNVTNWHINGSPLTITNYPFEGQSNSSYTREYAQGINATVNGATYNSTAGYDGFGAYEFDGNNDYLNITGIEGMRNMYQYTLTAWFKTTDSNGFIYDQVEVLGSKGTGAGDDYASLYLDSGNITFEFNTFNDATSITSPSTYNDGNWHHVAAVRTGQNSMELFIDGVSVGTHSSSSTGTGIDDPTAIRIGSETNGSNYFAGHIDDFVMYNRSFSSEQIQVLYQNQTKKIVSQETTVGDTWKACVIPSAAGQDGQVACSNNLTIVEQVLEYPAIQFIDPTLANQTLHPQSTFTINVSSNISTGDHYTFVNFDNSLLLWMRMDDVNSSGDPTDISGNGNNGSLQGDVLINSSGRFGDSAHFDGAGDFVNLPASNSLIDNRGTWSISMWFNPSSVPAASLGSRMLTLRNASGLSAVAFTLGNNDQVQFFYRNTSGTGKTIDLGSISLNSWYHYVVTYNGSGASVYLNGVLNTTISETIVGTSSDTSRIAASPSGGSQFYNGSIDELLIFNHQFTNQDVLSLYNATANQYDSSTPPLSEGNHTFIAYSMAANGLKNQTESRTVTIDLTAPTIHLLNATPNSTYNLTDVISLLANVSDLNGISAVNANITLPNSTVVQVSFIAAGSNMYEFNYTLPSVIGNYNATLIANDSAGHVNSSQTVSFALLNDLPTASSAIINNATDVTLTEAANTSIFGTATVTDLNGIGHLSTVTGYFYLAQVGQDAADNTSQHYTSTCSQISGSGTSASYNCSFNITHYAIPTDAGSNKSSQNWTFFVYPTDIIGSGNNDTSVVEMNTLSAFEISPSSINFGELDLGENTTNSNKQINITNNGNVALDVVLSGSNLSCASGLVPVNFLEYKDNPFTYGVGVDLLNTGVELDLDARFGTQQDPTPLKQTYYGLGMPLTGVAGSCNGTIVLTGESDPHVD